MRKQSILVFLALTIALFTKASNAKAADPLAGLFGLGDIKTQISYYDINNVWKFYCFTGQCYDITTDKLAFVKDIQPQITDLQNRVASLENQTAQQTIVAGASTLTPEQVSKAQGVKGEIQNYIDGLNSKIDAWNNTKFDDGSLNHNYYTIKEVEANPGTINWYSVIGYNNLKVKIDQTQAKLREITPIAFEVNDYLSTGVIPSAWDRAYLQSLGINW